MSEPLQEPVPAEQLAVDLPAEQLAVEEEIALLRAIRDALRGSAVNVAISNSVVQPVTMADFPFAGATRWLLPRIATGGTMALPSEEWTQVLFHNPNRIGGSIVNMGAHNVSLLLSGEKQARSNPAGIARVGLIAAGGSWDLRLANLLWGGSVSAFSVNGISSLEVAEV